MNNKDIFKAVGLVSAGVAAGSTCTYFGVRNKLKKKYEEAADREIAQVKKTYALLRKEGPYSDPATALAEYEKMPQQLEYAAAEASVEAREALVEEQVQQHADAEKVAVRNIFDDRRSDLLVDALENQDEAKSQQLLSMREAERIDQDEPDSSDDQSARDPQAPYVIPKDEYFDYSNEYEKLSLVYYEGDLTLTDDQDKIIRDGEVDGIVGQKNLGKFGEESDDINLVFIRNPRLNIDYEVTKDDREYTEVVLGIKTDPADNARRIRRMRDDE